MLKLAFGDVGELVADELAAEHAHLVGEKYALKMVKMIPSVTRARVAR